MSIPGEHVFLQRQSIEEADLNEILALSATGQLEWGSSQRMAAIGTNVGYSMGAEYALHHNLIEVRAGYTPHEDNAFNYLRLSDFTNNRYYVEHDTDDSLMPLAKKVLKLGMLAVTTETGRLSGTIEHCESCRQDTGHVRLYDAAHGIPGAVMTGSERCECVSCGHASRILTAA
jgi:hypothetical protein